MDGAIPEKALSLIRQPGLPKVLNIYLSSLWPPSWGVGRAWGRIAGVWKPDWAETPWNTRSQKSICIGYAAIMACLEERF